MNAATRSQVDTIHLLFVCAYAGAGVLPMLLQHAYLGTAIMALFLAHGALGLQLGLSLSS
jgi:hypothetical protein